jgi:hypothetical protein
LDLDHLLGNQISRLLMVSVPLVVEHVHLQLSLAVSHNLVSLLELHIRVLQFVVDVASVIPSCA